MFTAVISSRQQRMIELTLYVLMIRVLILQTVRWQKYYFFSWMCISLTEGDYHTWNTR